jgi:hypothetical protein
VQYGGQNVRKLYTVLSLLGVVFLMCIFGNCICLESIVVILCVFVVSYVCLLYLMCICCISCVFVVLLMCICCTVFIAVLTLDAGLLARSQYPEGPATGHLDKGFSWFPCVYKRMLRWFPSFQVATTCLSCSPPDLNFLVNFFSFHICVHVK